jgi:hypothetical protein
VEPNVWFYVGKTMISKVSRLIRNARKSDRVNTTESSNASSMELDLLDSSSVALIPSVVRQNVCSGFRGCSERAAATALRFL